MNKLLSFSSYFFIFLFCLSFSFALPSSLENYYPMDDNTSTTYALDVHAGINLYQSSELYTFTSYGGKQNTSLYRGAVGGLITNSLAFNNGESSFSINFWLNQSSDPDNNNRVGVFYYSNTYGFYLDGNTTGINNFRHIVNGIEVASTTINTTAKGLCTYNNFCMITYVYDISTYRAMVYINGIHAINFSTSNIPSSSYLFLYLEDSSFDELSVWSSTLNQTDINSLYNSSYGLNYFYTEDLSIGEPIIPSTISYTLYDICIPSIYGTQSLCHNLFVTNDSSPVCNITDLVPCPLGCIDQTGYWESINSSPATLNYSGECGFCPNPCSYSGQLSCENNYIKKCNLQENGCLAWEFKSICSGECINNSCNTLQTPIGVPSNITDDMFNDFFSLSSDTASNRLLIAIIGIILTAIIGIIIIAGLSYASGYNLPFGIGVIIVLSLTFLVFVYFVTIAFIPFWILLILIILLSFALGGKFLYSIFGGK